MNSDDFGFHFAAKKQPWFVPVVALIFGSLTVVCLFLPHATTMTAIFGGAGLLAVLLALNDQSKTRIVLFRLMETRFVFRIQKSRFALRTSTTF